MSVLTLVVAGCGGLSDRSLSSSATDAVGASSIDDVGGGESGSEGQGNLPTDTSDIVGQGETARTFIQLGRLGPLSTVKPLSHIYLEEYDGTPSIGLYLEAHLSPELSFVVELPSYPGGEGVFALPFEAAMHLTTWHAAVPSYEIAAGGRIVIAPTDAGARLNLEDVVMRVGDGALEEIGGGVIEGDIEPLCFYQASVAGAVNVEDTTYLEYDASWSSPFCAQYR